MCKALMKKTEESVCLFDRHQSQLDGIQIGPSIETELSELEKPLHFSHFLILFALPSPLMRCSFPCCAVVLTPRLWRDMEVRSTREKLKGILRIVYGKTFLGNMALGRR